MTDLMAKYRLTFGTAHGREILSDILSMTHFGGTLNPDNKAQIAEYNVGIAILAKMGVFSRGTKESVVRALVSIIPEEIPEQ